MAIDSQSEAISQDVVVGEEKHTSSSHLEATLSEKDVSDPTEQNLVYDDDQHEPEIHMRTWLALAACSCWTFAQLMALLGPPSVLGIIAGDLGATSNAAWIPNCLILVQAASVNLLSQISDLFQARKWLLVGCTSLAVVGSAIAPGSQSLGRLVAAQVLIGCANAIQVIVNTVPSEILPSKWRPMAQAALNITGAGAMVAAPLTMGALCKAFPDGGWRKFYWIELGLWSLTVVFVTFGYRPPKRHTRYDHLGFWGKLQKIDLTGAFFLASGLCLLLTGLSIGGGQYPWVSAPPLTTLILGFVLLVVFGVYEWKGTTTGLIPHGLFQNGRSEARSLLIFLLLITIEGAMLYTYILFYPTLTVALFEQDLVLVAARVIISYAALSISNVLWSYLAVKLRSVRETICCGFLIYLGATIGFSTIQPGQNVATMAFAGMLGFGLGGLYSQIFAGVQLVSPHKFIATVTALTLSCRSIAVTIFTAIYSNVVNENLTTKLPSYIERAAENSGLAPASIPAFVEAISAGSAAVAEAIPGVTDTILTAGDLAREQAYADSIRVPYIISAPFILVAVIACWWLGDLKKAMTYHVDAPVEKLNAKADKHNNTKGEA